MRNQRIIAYSYLLKGPRRPVRGDTTLKKTLIKRNEKGGSLQKPTLFKSSICFVYPLLLKNTSTYPIPREGSCPPFRFFSWGKGLFLRILLAKPVWFVFVKQGWFYAWFYVEGILNKGARKVCAPFIFLVALVSLLRKTKDTRRVTRKGHYKQPLSFAC